MAAYAGDYYQHQQQQQQPGAGPISITRGLRNHGGLSINVGDANRGRVASPQQHHQDDYGYDEQEQRHGHGQEQYGYAEEAAHDILDGGSDEEVAEQLQVRNGQHGQPHHQQQQHYAYEEDLHGEQGLDHGEGEEEDLEDDAFSDSLSSSPSIPDEDIDFNLVYALHTFLATVDGQASVVKGDKLLLLDDSNSYWWLVRVLKTQAIGYIPAENIETPWERLARLNKHRNVDLTSATQQDVITGPTSTTAQTRFIGRIPPSQQPHPHESRHPWSKGIPASPSHKDHPRNISPMPEARPGSSKAKVVLFTAPTYYAHSATGMTTDDEEGLASGEEGYEGEYDDEGMEVDEDGHERGGFEEDEDEEEIDDGHQAGGEESEFSDDGDGDGDGDEHDLDSPVKDVDAPTPIAGAPAALGDELASEADEAAKREHWERERAAAMQAQQQAEAAEAQWARDKAASSAAAVVEEEGARALTPQAQTRQALSPSPVVNSPASPSSSSAAVKRALSPRFEGDGVSAAYSPTQRSPALNGSTSSRSAFDENAFASGPTKKLTATPPIARSGGDDEMEAFDPLADAELEAAPYEFQHRPPQAQSPPSLHTAPPTSHPLSPSSSAGSQPQRVRGVDLVDPKDPRYNRMLQPTKQAGEDVVYERMMQQQQQQQYQQQQAQQAAPAGKRSFDAHEADTSLNSVDTGASSVLSEGSASSGGKRASTSGGKGGESGTDKKRKSGGGILGLFRKKDKKKKGSSSAAATAQTEDEPRSSEESSRASPTSGGLLRRSGSASPASPRSSADRQHGQQQPGLQKRESTTATAESMFSTDAALRQQELEAKQALYQQYGVQRQPGDVSNTMTPRGVGLGVGGGGAGGGLEPQPRSSTGSNRNSLQLLTHPASVVAANGVLHSPSNSLTGAVGGGNGGLAPPQRIRPGSLMGSPSIPGLEVPLLSVMRVFAGPHIESEATFKTVLLNQSTTAADLVKQAMQRFRLVGADLTREDFFLTVKELDGDERALMDEEKPLGIFEELSERHGEDGTLPPSVKRSSIGSINSISSNLSLNPAITRLGMNDWSDDSAVKFYLNRRGGPSPIPLHDGPQYGEDAPTPTLQQGELDSNSDHTATPTLGSPAQMPTPPQQQHSPQPSFASSNAPAPSYRFAVRLLIHPADLPDSVVFDPQSNAIIPKTVLAERQSRAGGFADVSPTLSQGGSGAVSPSAREKIIFFPRNANVSEVVEAALDRFGIVDGVVDGGDEVEDRVSRRRSVTRVKYSLAAQVEGREMLLNASSKLLEAYSLPPLFKAYDRSSKEFKRRSIDATLSLGSSADVQPSDPVFVLRRSTPRPSGVAARGPHPQTIDELEERQQREEEQEVLAGGDSPPVERSPSLGGSTTSQRDLIAAQRAAQRANQRAILSAQKNGEQGIDINIPEQGTIRSTRTAENDEVRYSFINQDGTEVDISEIVEHEWSTRSAEPLSPATAAFNPQRGSTPTGLRPSSRLSRSTSAAPSTDGAESFQTARSAPISTDDEDEQQAIDALKGSNVDVDLANSAPYKRALSPASSSSATPQASVQPSNGGEDVLRDALGPRPVTSPVFNETLQERLDRVLARVKEEKARRAASPGGSRPRSYISAASGSATPSGRLSPAALSGRVPPGSRSPSSLSGRRSPFGEYKRTDSPSIDQILRQSPRDAASPPPPSSSSTRVDSRAESSSRHAKKPSLASLSSVSGGSSSATTAEPSTPGTAGSSAPTTNGTNGAAFTPASSATSNHPPLQPQIVYRDNYGFEALEAIVRDAERPRRRRDERRDPAVEGLFGREMCEVHPQVKAHFEAPRKQLDELDNRLDALLLQLVGTA
ncbi:hypothetical protein JCM8097_009373 [Rhodosporidiobolus ruineniae]